MSSRPAQPARTPETSLQSRRIRLGDLAEIAGVSVATVSRALNDSPSVNNETKRRVWKIAREHNYAFRPSMPAVLSGAEATILIAIPTPQGRDGHVSDPFYLELIGGVCEAARESRSDVVISHIEPSTKDDLTFLMTENRADGVIFLGQSSLHDRFNRLAETEDRFIVWGADLPGQQYCSIGSDNVRGGRRATAHLARMGRRRIAFLGDTEAPEARQRHKGYLAGLAAAGLELDPELVLPVHFEVESAEAAVDALITSGAMFDGVVAASDLIAMGAIRAIIRSGRAVPSDVSVVGYDNLRMSAYGRPALTTISQDMAKAGRIMVSKLLNAAGGLQSERLSTDLIVRESCGA